MQRNVSCCERFDNLTLTRLDPQWGTAVKYKGGKLEPATEGGQIVESGSIAQTSQFFEPVRSDQSRRSVRWGEFEIVLQKEQPGEFQRWGRNHWNSASGRSIYFSRAVATM
jgi:hypothetical protein